MVDFSMFLKAIVRISIHAQEKLGGVNQDKLQQKLLKDQELNKVAEAQKKQSKDKFKKKEAKDQKELDSLK